MSGGNVEFTETGAKRDSMHISNICHQALAVKETSAMPGSWQVTESMARCWMVDTLERHRHAQQKYCSRAARGLQGRNSSQWCMGRERAENRHRNGKGTEKQVELRLLEAMA